MPAGWSEESTTIAEVKERIRAFLAERGWESRHSPKNLAMSIAIESAELMEIFQWVDSNQAHAFAVADPDRFLHVRQEVADVVIYCISLANALGFDLAKAIDEKIENNERRYPAGGERRRVTERGGGGHERS